MSKKKVEELKEIAVKARKLGVLPSTLLEGEQACFLEAKATPSSPDGRAEILLECTKEKWKEEIEKRQSKK